MDQFTKNTLRFAKILVDSGGVHTGANDKNTFHSALEKWAGEEKLDNETIQQAYTRLAVTTDEGRLLFKAIGLAPAPLPTADLPIRKAAPEPAGEASKQLNELARVAAAKQGVTFAKAYVDLLTSPEHAALASRVRAEELRKSATAFA